MSLDSDMALGGALTALGSSLALTIDSCSSLLSAWFFFWLPTENTNSFPENAAPESIPSTNEIFSSSTRNDPPVQIFDSNQKSPSHSTHDPRQNDDRIDKEPSESDTGLVCVLQWLWNHRYTMWAALAKAPLAIMASGAGWIAINELGSSNHEIAQLGIIFGLLLARRGTGTGVGPLAGNALLRSGSSEAVAWMSFLAIGLTSISILVQISGWWWLTILSLLLGMGGKANWVFSSVIVQRSTPGRIIGRISGIETLSWVRCQSIAVLATAWPRYLGVSIAESARPSIVVAIVWIGLLQARILWNKRSFKKNNSSSNKN